MAEHPTAPLSERLRGIVAADYLDAPTGYWGLADWHFARAVAAGADPETMIRAVSGCLTGGEAAAIITDPARRWNSARPASALRPTDADLEAIAFAARAIAERCLDDEHGASRYALEQVADLLARVLPSAPRFA
ncbi:hypothetical protein [Nocardia sp. NPDC050435]|uniref:hypothetical protein n=1 Tax=Nocardia sp. NPDC050435 TaxID=3155040 RepID=UPI0033F4828A